MSGPIEVISSYYMDFFSYNFYLGRFSSVGKPYQKRLQSLLKANPRKSKYNEILVSHERYFTQVL